ncbi:hypothetical protein [Nostoc linckia]|uniref:hypothetical protein n=1 Tax=Nostoc linckia TaxID=92942 RepID=UPI0015D514DA|nr:hypothetical protein [Nostoc linckia]
MSINLQLGSPITAPVVFSLSQSRGTPFFERVRSCARADDDWQLIRNAALECQAGQDFLHSAYRQISIVGSRTN